MFVLQKQLSVLNVPSSRVGILYRSGADIQLALPDLPSQMGSAYMVLLKGGGKAQVLIGLHLSESCRNIFYVSNAGEVPVERAEQELEAGQVFAESMGFILNDAELGRLTAEQQEVYWKSLPICQRQTEIKPANRNVEPVIEAKPLKIEAEPVKIDLQEKRIALRENLGKLLSSL